MSQWLLRLLRPVSMCKHMFMYIFIYIYITVGRKKGPNVDILTSAVRLYCFRLNSCLHIWLLHKDLSINTLIYVLSATKLMPVATKSLLLGPPSHSNFFVRREHMLSRKGRKIREQNTSSSHSPASKSLGVYRGPGIRQQYLEIFK